MSGKSCRLQTSDETTTTFPIDDDIEVLPTETINVLIDSSDDEQGSVISIVTTVGEHTSGEDHGGKRTQNISINPEESDVKLIGEVSIKAEDEDVQSYVVPYLKSLVPVPVNNTNNIEIIDEEEIMEEPCRGAGTSAASDGFSTILNSCSMCGFVASERGRYLQHLNDVHKVTLHECAHCSAKYLHEEFLLSHVEETHSELSVMKCFICRKHFSGEIQLRVHLVTDHSIADSVPKERLDFELGLVSRDKNSKTKKDRRNLSAGDTRRCRGKNSLKRLNSCEKMIVDSISNKKRHEYLDKCKKPAENSRGKSPNRDLASEQIDRQSQNSKHAELVDSVRSTKEMENKDCGVENAIPKSKKQSGLVSNVKQNKTLNQQVDNVKTLADFSLSFENIDNSDKHEKEWDVVLEKCSNEKDNVAEKRTTVTERTNKKRNTVTERTNKGRTTVTERTNKGRDKVNKRITKTERGDVRRSRKNKRLYENVRKNNFDNISCGGDLSDKLPISNSRIVSHNANNSIETAENQSKDVSLKLDENTESVKAIGGINDLIHDSVDKINIENESENSGNKQPDDRVNKKDSAVNDKHYDCLENTKHENPMANDRTKDDKKRPELSINDGVKCKNNETEVNSKSKRENRDYDEISEHVASESRAEAKYLLENILVDPCDGSDDAIQRKKLLANMLSYLQLLEKVSLPKLQEAGRKDCGRNLRSTICKQTTPQCTSLETKKDKPLENDLETDGDAVRSRTMLTKPVSKPRRRQEVYQCFVCNSKMTRERELVSHTRVQHVDYDSMQCLVCERKFGYFRTLKRHFCYNHGVTDIRLDRDFKFIEKTTNASKKDMENRIEVDGNAGKTSSTNRTDVEKPEPSVTINRVKTEAISSTTDTVWEDTERRFSCSLCDFSTHDRSMLKKHMKHVHKTVLSHKCSYCEKSFGAICELTRHLQRFHGYSERLLCLSCHRKFKYLKVLEEHFRDRHGTTTKLQPDVDFKVVEEISRCTDINTDGHRGRCFYKCPKCSFKSTTRSCMRLHIQTHVRQLAVDQSVRETQQNKEGQDGAGSDKSMSEASAYFSPPRKGVDLLKISRDIQQGAAELKSGLLECEKRTVFVAKPFGKNGCEQSANAENKIIEGSCATAVSPKAVDVPAGDGPNVTECRENDTCHLNVGSAKSDSNSVLSQQVICMSDEISQKIGNSTDGIGLRKSDNFNLPNETSVSDIGRQDGQSDKMAVDEDTDVEGSKLSDRITPSGISIEKGILNEDVKEHVIFSRSKTPNVTARSKRQSCECYQITTNKIPKLQVSKNRESSVDKRETNNELNSHKVVGTSPKTIITERPEESDYISTCLNLDESTSDGTVNDEELNTESLKDANIQFRPTSDVANYLTLFTNERSDSGEALQQATCDTQNHFETTIQNQEGGQHSDTDLEVANIFSTQSDCVPAVVSVEVIVGEQSKDDVIVIIDSPMCVTDINEDNIEVLEEASSCSDDTACSKSNDSMVSSKKASEVDTKTIDNVMHGTVKGVSEEIDKIEDKEKTVDIINDEIQISSDLAESTDKTVYEIDSDDDIIFVNTYVENERNIKNIEVIEEITTDKESLGTGIAVDNVEVEVSEDDKKYVSNELNKVDTDLSKVAAKNEDQFKISDVQPTKSSSQSLYECLHCSSKHATKIGLLMHINKVHPHRSMRRIAKATKTKSSEEISDAVCKISKSKLIKVLSDVSLKIVSLQSIQEKAKEKLNTGSGLEECIGQSSSQIARTKDNLRVNHEMTKLSRDSASGTPKTDELHVRRQNTFCSRCRLQFSTEVEFSSHLRFGHRTKPSVKCTHCQFYHPKTVCVKSVISEESQSSKDCQSLMTLQSSKDSQSSDEMQLSRDLQEQQSSKASSTRVMDLHCHYCQEVFFTAFDRWEHIMNAHEKEALEQKFKSKDEGPIDKSVSLKSDVKVPAVSKSVNVSPRKPSYQTTNENCKNQLKISAELSGNKYSKGSSDVSAQEGVGSETEVETEKGDVENKFKMKDSNEDRQEISSELLSEDPSPRRRDRLYKCGLCRYRTGLREQLMRHLRSVHERVPGAPRCPLCEYAGPPDEVLEHLAAAHHAACPASASGCPVCGYARRWGAALAGRGPPCDRCPLTFATGAALASHRALAHPGAPPPPAEHACAPCGLDTGDDAAAFVEHLCRVHDARHVYRCAQCSFESTVRLYLQDHVRIVHDRLSCPTCDLSAPFTAGEKRDKCICRTVFKSRGPSWPSVAEPLEADDTPEEAPARRLCHQCGWMFASRARLEAHSTQHDGEEKSQAAHG